jgi:hypothetical protein
MTSPAPAKTPDDLAQQSTAAAQTLVTAVQAYEVHTAADADHAVEWARRIKHARTTCEAERAKVSTALRRQATENDARWKPAIALFDRAIAELKSKNTAFEATVQARAQALLAEAVSAPEQIAEVVAIMSPRDTSKAHITTRRFAEVTDLRAFLRWVVDQPDPSVYVDVRMAELNRAARTDAPMPAGVERREVKDTVLR